MNLKAHQYFLFLVNQNINFLKFSKNFRDGIRREEWYHFKTDFYIDFLTSVLKYKLSMMKKFLQSVQSYANFKKISTDFLETIVKTKQYRKSTNFNMA